MTLDKKYDVIVVGGGPAGSATATHLARAGRSVLLLDRAGFPRDKPCGEFYSPPVRGMLQTLGVYEDVLAAGPQRVTGAQVRCAGGRGGFTGSFTASRPQSPWANEGGFSLERIVLDDLLWQNAARCGAETRSGVSVRDVLQDARTGRIAGVRTDTGDFSAPLVVGADGSHSRIARAMNVVRPLPHLQKIALVAHYADVSAAEEEEPGIPSVEMHLGANRSVVGMAPGPGARANVTLVVGHGESSSIARLGPEAYANARLAADFPQVARRLGNKRPDRIVTCGTCGHTTITPVADGALLVGDAATFIDPFTGEGVYFGLRGAELAVEAIENALRRGDTSARGLAGYARARRRELAPKYMVCDLVQRIVHEPALIEAVARRFRRRPHLVERLLGVTGDMISPYRLLSPRYLLSFATA